MNLRHILPCFLLFAGLSIGSASHSLAQDTAVPPDLINNLRHNLGDKIRFCIDEGSPVAAFNRELSLAVADALFVEAEFVSAPHAAYFPLDGDGYMAELQLLMSQSCEVYAGVSIVPGETGLYPDWTTVTRPFAEFSFVFLVGKDTYAALGDLPAGSKAGAIMGSAPQGLLLLHNGQRPKDKRLMLLPYGDPDLMLTRVLDGSIEGAAIYQPLFVKMLEDKPEKFVGLKQVSFSPMSEPSVPVGYLLTAKDSYLRSQLDETIVALAKDGTIQSLIDRFGYQGHAVP